METGIADEGEAFICSIGFLFRLLHFRAGDFMSKIKYKKSIKCVDK